MQDAITIKRIQQCHPKLRDEAGKIYAEIVAALKGKAICRFAYTLRTFKEQDALYAQGRNGDKRPKVTNAKGGQSYHNYGLAIDIVLLKDTDGNGSYETASWETAKDFDFDQVADWMEVVKIFKAYGWEWGGDWRFKDLPHFQKTFGQSEGQLLQLHANRKVDAEGFVILN